MSPVIDRIFQVFAGAGRRRYGMEAVSQTEHALQCASLAERERAGSALVAAALLHDIGHLLHEREGAAEQGIDDRHEAGGAAFLGQWFGEEVTLPVARHVAAKQYLCAVEPVYFHSLSEGSRRSLELQGGPFDTEAASAFIASPGAAEAVRLRRWDDKAKVRGLRTLTLDEFRPHLEVCLLPQDQPGT